MTKRLKNVHTVFSILLHAGVFAALWCPWTVWHGEKQGLLSYVLEIHKLGGGIEACPEDAQRVFASYLFWLAIAVSILSAVWAVCRIGGKNLRIVYKAVVGLEFAYTAACIIMCPMIPMPWTYILFVLCWLDYMAGQYLEQRDEIYREALLRKQREREAKRERRRRLYFPGHYSSWFYRMILKNVKYHIRNYVMFILSGTFFVLFLFLIFSIQHAFSEVHTGEFAIVGGGMQEILLKAVWIGVILNAALMGLSFSYYFKNKMREEEAYVLLGIRGKTLTRIMIMEYAGCLICAGILGVGLGNILLRTFLHTVSAHIPVSGASVPGSYYLILLLIFAAISLIAGAVNSHIYTHMRREAAGGFAAKTTRAPGRFLWLYGGLGAALMCDSAVSFASRDNCENILFQGCFLGGLYLFLIFASAIWGKRIKPGKHAYYDRLFSDLPFLTRFRQNTGKVFLLCAAAFLVMYSFTSLCAGSRAAEKGKHPYPYDFVCAGTSGEDAYIRELAEKYSLTLHEIPMFRVVPVKAADNDSFFAMLTGSYGRPVAGWQSGISESGYLELKKLAGEKAEPLGLSGEEIHLVYQTDAEAKARPVDLYYPEEGPHLFLGTDIPPLMGNYALWKNWKVKSEERTALTGMNGDGAEENLIVFSDEFFEKQYEEAEKKGEVTTLWLLNCTEDAAAYEKAAEALAERAAMYDTGESGMQSVRDMVQAETDMETERYLNRTVWIFILFMTGAGGIYLLFVKFCFELDEIVGKYRFLSCMGMTDKKVKRTLRGELLPYWLAPFVLGGGAAVIFTMLMFRVRMYSAADCINYLSVAAVIWLAYWALQAAAYAIIRKILLREIFKKGEMGDAGNDKNL